MVLDWSNGTEKQNKAKLPWRRSSTTETAPASSEAAREAEPSSTANQADATIAFKAADEDALFLIAQRPCSEHGRQELES